MGANEGAILYSAVTVDWSSRVLFEDECLTKCRGPDQTVVEVLFSINASCNHIVRHYLTSATIEHGPRHYVYACLCSYV